MTKDYLRFIIILDERGLQWWKRWKEVSDFCEPLAWNRACIRTLLQMNILPEEKLCGSTKYKIFIMYIKQYISAIRTLTSKFSDQKRKKMNRERPDSCRKSEAKKKELSWVNVRLFTFTQEKMFAESEENGKDLPETLSS